LLPVGLEESSEARTLFSWRKPTPVMPFERQTHSPMHDLERFVQVFPVERGAQDRMPIDHLLPALVQGRYIQPPMEETAPLDEIDSLLRSIEGVKEEALLER
jgi:hypothetical protein